MRPSWAPGSCHITHTTSIQMAWLHVIWVVLYFFFFSSVSPPFLLSPNFGISWGWTMFKESCNFFLNFLSITVKEVNYPEF